MAELSPIIFGAINISPASIIFSLKAVEISPLPPSIVKEILSKVISVPMTSYTNLGKIDEIRDVFHLFFLNLYMKS